MIVIVDYGMGNLGSILNMFRRAGVQAVVTGDPDVVARAERLVLPGVGSFDHGVRNLSQRGLLPVLTRKALEERVPTLGVCLGMQLMMERSEEGSLPGLGWIGGECVRFDLSAHPKLQTLHMGWNTLDVRSPHPLLPTPDGFPRFYFVHGYHVVCRTEQNVLATSVYGYRFASVVARDNVVGVQFHPEKSHRYGMALFAAFAAMGAGEELDTGGGVIRAAGAR